DRGGAGEIGRDKTVLPVMVEGDAEAGGRSLHVEGEDRVGEIVALLEEERGAAGAGGGAGARNARELGLFEGDPGGAAGRIGDREDVAVEHVIELQPAGGGSGRSVVDDEVVELQ